MIDEQRLLEFIHTWECEWLDFKREHHNNKASLIHDIICLANADHLGYRYLMFGVDNNCSIVGISGDTNRRTQENIITIMRSARFNHMPKVSMQELYMASGRTVDILCIHDLPYKPYLVLEDYKYQGITVRAGVPYTRVGDTNIPIDRCPDDKKVERMYQQRFGLDLTPIERLKNYLHDKENWKNGVGEGQNSIFHYEQFPEFTIAENDNFDEEYQEPWISQFPNKRHAHISEYFAKYHDTILTSIYSVCCNEGHYVTALPNMWTKHTHQTYYQTYYFIKDSMEYLAVQMMITVGDPVNCRAPSIAKVFAMFDSKDDAELSIEADFAAGMHQYVFYSYDEATHLYSRIEKGVSNA